MNIPCESCHGANNAVPEPGIKECSRCHDPAKLAEKTEPSDPTKHNPHRSPPLRHSARLRELSSRSRGIGRLLCSMPQLWLQRSMSQMVNA
nr:cytochrome c3 family protein [Sutterella wadsworthensis]